MILVPAIDIRDGRVVRLEQGDFERETMFADSPLETARRFQAEGARLLHVVDLDGARGGEPVNLHHLRQIAEDSGLSVQWGGGVRSLAAVGEAFEAGADRVVLGTAAYRNPRLLESALERFGDRVAVAVDVKGGRAAVAGWTEGVEIPPEQAIADMQRRGVERFVYTSVERDGLLEGPDLDGATRAGGAVRGGFLYSGGVGTVSDLAALGALGLETLDGVIAGRALYAGRFTISEGRAALGER